MSEAIKLGDHRLLCGDSCKPEDVERLMGGALADTVLTDPPYGMHYKIANDNQDIEWYEQWLPLSFSCLKQWGNWLAFGNTKTVFQYYYEGLRDEILANELTVRPLLKWDKGFGAGTLSTANTTFVETGELLLYIVKGDVRDDKHYAKFFSPLNEKALNDLRELILRAGGIRRVMDKLGTTSATHWRSRSEFAVPNEAQLHALCELAGEPFEKYAGMKKYPSAKQAQGYFDNTVAKLNDTLRYSPVINGSAERLEGGGHITMKPVVMLEDIIKMTTPEGGIVVDLFGGSGSTLIACEHTGRKCYMMELEPKYIETICARYEKHHEQIKNNLFAGMTA